MDQKPKRFDVVRISFAKKIEVGKSSSEPQWLLNLTAPFEIIATNLSHVLGQPLEINSLNPALVDFTKVVPITLGSPSAEDPGLTDQASNQSSGPTTSANSRISQIIKQHYG